MNIIPAIDIQNGKCVRLTQGDFRKEIIYNNDPIFVAKNLESKGAKKLHIIDLDGARNGNMKNIDIILKIKNVINIPLQVGGGIRNAKVVKQLITRGIEDIILGTIVIEDKNYFQALVKTYKKNIIVSLDAEDIFLATKGWIEKTQNNIFQVIDYLEKLNIKKIIYTDISKDGMLSGPNLAMIEKIKKYSDIPLIVSGGISSQEDIEKLEALGIEEVIVGKALYEGRVLC